MPTTASEPLKGRRRPVAQPATTGSHAPDTPHLLEALAALQTARTPAQAMRCLVQARMALRVDQAVFISFIREELPQGGYHCLAACDPRWSLAYATHRWHTLDPWLQHAERDGEPVWGTELSELTPEQTHFIATANELGWHDVLLVPAPPPKMQSRTGLLVLGSAPSGALGGRQAPNIRCLARSLAMELNAWWIGWQGRELISRAQLTPEDRELLRWLRDGHSSKSIGLMLNTAARTLDCRIQRLCHRLGVANRKEAIARAVAYRLI